MYRGSEAWRERRACAEEEEEVSELQSGLEVLEALEPPSSLAATGKHEPVTIRVGAVQHRWHPDPEEHEEALAAGARIAAERGAQLICMQELTLSKYFAQERGGPEAAGVEPEDPTSGRTFRFAQRLARETGAHVHASLFERTDDLNDGRGYNTAIVVSPQGELVSRTRKLHIPITAGYHEDKYFAPGPIDDPYPTLAIGPAKLGFPTCWDQWFPELARAYALEGADALVYPTAIGSEPDHPDFDTEPLWEKVMIGHGIANGLFVIAVNRIGTEDGLTFYGSSFISDPYGRKLVQAGRDKPAVLIAELDLSQRRDWLELFPFMTTRRPEIYGALAE